ncbi:hypothetical protein ACFSYD_15485 [Paracoccus aerius]
MGRVRGTLCRAPLAIALFMPPHLLFRALAVFSLAGMGLCG